jgi:hypothetical protein
MIYGNEPPSAFYKMRINRIKAAEVAKLRAPTVTAWTEAPADFANVLARAIGIVRDGDEPAVDKTKLN